ncbi:MAG: PqqD family protein [Lachnospiraceae bacterium]|nr:PqqD family protein [Lachnospiraceae bacterium]
MRRNNSYTLTEIAGVPYLLPYGQMVADHKPGIRLNETGIFLWKLLEQEHSVEELVRLCADSYEITDSQELRELTVDIKEFVTGLCQRNILVDDSLEPYPFTHEKYLCIAGLTTKLIGPEEAFSHQFDAFCTSSCAEINQTIRIHIGEPGIKPNGTVLLRNEELVVMEQPEHYILLFPASPKIIEASLSKNGKFAEIYCMPPYTDLFREELFHAIRLVWLYLAQKNSMMAIHSASILYQGKAWLFSGPSGTGKSTHTTLWNKHWGAPILNGDLNLLSLENGQPVIHGIPWCGTSGISDSKTYPLGGIVLLKKAPTDYVEKLPDDHRTLSVMNRFISPLWTKDMLRQNLNFATTLSEKILICRLNCTKEKSAAETMKSYIEEYLKKGF